MKVFSFCLYGDKPKYIRGMHENIKIITEKFPDWKVYIYYKDCPIEQFLGYTNVVAILGNYSGTHLMLDRFCAIDESDVEIMMVRDADSRIHIRDEWCIRQFLESPKPFHIIRDNGHHRTFILGGLWGIKKNCIRVPLRQLIDIFREKNSDSRAYDQMFLEKVIYSKIADRALIHGGICAQYETNILIPFKTPHLFCGQVIEFAEDGSEYHNCEDCSLII
jgi:protein O-GlcNAc transferase